MSGADSPAPPSPPVVAGKPLQDALTFLYHHFSCAYLTLKLPAGGGWQTVATLPGPQGRGASGPGVSPALALPLRVEDELLGVLELGRAEPAFSAADAALLAGFAPLLAGALQQQRRLAPAGEARNRAVQMRAIKRISRALAAADDLDTIFASIRSELFALTEPTGISVLLLTADRQHLEWVYGYEYGARLDVAGMLLPVTEGFSGYVVRSGEPLLLNADMAAQAEAYGSFSVGAGPTAWLGVPLQVASDVIGVLSLENAENPAAFGEGDVQLLTTVSGPIATAITNLQRLAQIRANQATAERLYRAGRRITEAGSMAGIYEALVDFVAASGLVDVAFIMRPDPDARAYMIADHLWSRLGIEADASRNRVYRDAFPATDLLTHNQVRVIADGQTDPLLDARTRQLFVQNGIRAAAFIPIYAEGQWQATLVLNRVEAVPPTARELQPFQTLCDQAAVALANLQLLRETGTLYRVSRALNQALTAEDALKTVADKVAQYTGAPQVHIIFYDRQARVCQVAAEYAPSGRADSLACAGPDDALRARFLYERRPYLARTNAREEMVRHYLEHFGLETALLVPIAGQEQLYGMLALAAPDGRRQFTRAHLNFLRSTSDQLTTFLENIDLFNEALDRAQELVTLNRIGARLASILDLEALVRVTYEEVDRLFDTTVFLLAAYAPAEQRYTPLLHIEHGEEVEDHPRTLPRGGPLHAFLHAGEVLAGDAALALAAATAPPGSAPGARAALWLPLQQEGRPIGLLAVQSDRPEPYGENEIQLLRGVATQAGLALSNARLFAETEANVRQIEAANERLRELDRVKTQFLANMSHELRTPLNSIIGFSRVILKGIDGPITPRQEEDLTSIYTSGQHLLLLINDILDLAKIEAGKMALVFEPVDLAEVARSVLATTRGLLKDRPVTLFWDIEPDLPAIEADAMRLRQILLNLLSNAAKYTEEGTIHCRIREDGEAHLLLVVSDSGIGIAPKDYDKLFASFEQAGSAPTRAVEGTGLGLPITRSLVEMHGGQIWFESELGVGSSFYVRLPLSQPQPPAGATH